MEEKNVWFPSEKDVEDFELLVDMLNSQRKEFDLLSKKKADGQLNQMKIKMANRVLEPLKELLSHEDSNKFLDTLEEDNIPTYSDLVLIISQYETAIYEFKEKYHKYDEYYGDKRWMTDEFPPDYYQSEDYEDEIYDE